MSDDIGEDELKRAVDIFRKYSPDCEVVYIERDQDSCTIFTENGVVVDYKVNSEKEVK
jgi:hypothetical protein